MRAQDEAASMLRKLVAGDGTYASFVVKLLVAQFAAHCEERGVGEAHGIIDDVSRGAKLAVDMNRARRVVS